MIPDKIISLNRLYSQQIATQKYGDPVDLVDYMGAIQAQDLPMALLAVGIRTINSTFQSIADAFNSGRIIRTHVMRPTWHFVSPENIFLMLELTAPQIKRSMTSRNRELELTPEIFSKSFRLIENALSINDDLTKDEIQNILKESGIESDDHRIYHILMNAELDGIICSGKMKKNRQTYSLLEKISSGKGNTDHDEAVAVLAKKYFTSHAPATIKDFAWWSNLPSSDLKKVPALLSGDFYFDEEFLLPESFKTTVLPLSDPKTYFLPAYDEFLIGYSNRSASLKLIGDRRHASANGIFYPVIVTGGQVNGFWKKKKTSKITVIETEIVSGKINEKNNNLSFVTSFINA